MYAKMKRKVAKGGRLRLSPNEEALLLKEEYERRRRLRLQQVREQERYIAVQIRQEVKQRRDEQLHQLAEELKAEWWKAQNQKIKALEKLYLSSLRAVGEGHRQAKENEPDLVALAKEAEERKQRAEKRHKEALKEQKNQKEKLLKEQTWRTNARKHAMYVEKERAAKIASLPPPVPHPFENFEVKRLPTVKVYNADNFSVTHHHLSEPYVDREMDTHQPDARLVAEEEAKRLDELQKEGERDRREQLEKAHLRGSHALKMVHLAQDRERLMKELEQMQNMDLARRRQIVAQMPPQLFEPAYRRMEIKEDWQRELEFAFEDMYSGDRKMKGDMILHLEPQPLPIPSDRSQDEDLDISLEPDFACETQPKLDDVTEEESKHPNEPENHEMRVAPQPQSKLVLKKLLNKIRSQKDQWTSKCEAEIQSEIETIESGTLASEERRLCDSAPGHEQHTDSVSEAIESPEMLEHTIIAGNSVLIHPQEQAAKIRMEIERQKQIEQIEQQKQQQLILLKQIEEKRICLEAEFLKVQMQAQLEEIKKKEQEEKTASVELQPDPLMNQQREVEHKTEIAAVPGTSSSNEENHIQMIRNYQQCLLLQNRLHKQSVEEARKQLQEYQNKLKQRYPSISMPLGSAVTLQSRSINLKPTTCESVLQMCGPTMLHRDHPSANQSSVQDNVQECAPPLITHSRTHFVLEKPFEQRDDEQRHNMGSSRQIQSIEASQSEQRQFHLPQQNYPSQEQMEILGPPDNQVRDLSESQKLPGSVMMTSQDASVMMQTEAHIQRDSSALPTEESSESSRTLGLDKKPVMSQKMPNLLIETEAQKQPQLIVLDTPASEGSLIAQAASFDSSAYQQLPTESSIKQTLPQAFQHLTSFPDEAETGAIQESLASKNGGASLLNYSSILKLRERVLASSESIQAQQDHLKELQEELDVQREALLSRQRMQEELLLRKQAVLKEQMQRQQEALKDFLNKQAEESVTYREMTETQKSDHFNQMTYLFEDAENKSQELNCDDVNKYDENRLLSQSISQAEQIEQSQRILGREQRWRTSKPPLAKIKLGLDLEQHELSVIPELDTPRSGKVSFTDSDKTDSVSGEASLISSVEELVSGMCNSESVHEERDLSIAKFKEQGSSENPRYTNQLSSSWHERLMVDANSSHEPANPKDSVVMGQNLPIYAADVGRGVITDSGPSFRPDSTVALSKGWTTSFAPQACAREAACDYLFSATISTGSFLTSEKLDLSPANTELFSSNSAEDRILRETASSPWDSSASPTPTTAQQRQENSSEVSEFHLPAEENFISNRSQIQQIIDKYTKDLNWLPENSTTFHAPAIGFDFSDMERNFPNFQHQLFQPLEPSPDFDISSSLSQHKISEDSKDFSKSFAFSIQSQDTSVFPEATSSSLKARSYNPHSFLNTKKLNNTISQAEESIKANVTLGSEESFHLLQLESTLKEQSQSTEQPIGLHIVFEPNSKIKISENENYVSPVGDQYEGLARNIENTNLQSSVESLRSPTLSSLEELGSFYQLITTQITENETLLTEHSVKEVVELRKENLCFEELPVVTPNKHKELAETPVLRNEANRIVEGDHSQCSKNILEEEQSILEVQMSSRMPRAIDSEIYVSPSQATRQQNGGLPEIPQNQNSNSVLTISSGPHSLQSRVPVWETESGRGIMEEPELTLISSNDISVAESDSEHISQEKKRENKFDSLAYAGHSELKSCSEGREFLPLDPEADYSVFTLSDYSAIAQSPNEDQSPLHQSAVMLLEFTSTPGCLQESFLRRKKNFIQKSSKRVEEIKKRERSSENPQAKLFQRDKTERFNMPKEDSPTSGAVVSQLKKVGEVKVCSREDKRSADVQMQQRTLRLYNQLAEVKIRKEEKSRQETYAKNREKAKEFQKKTLEKLRAKMTH